MIALPRHLAPWAAHLALFPEDIALSIGPMVSRIAALVGGWREDYAAHGTPDGHAGIDTRGLYDRLLATEWAMLEELPEEFLRRAVSGEHLFLQRAYQDLAAARQSIVLFDAGPDQLGAPRLAHLAILIALGQRAAAHDATLQWGTFQDRDRHLADGVTKSNVRDLLRARCEQPVTADDIRAWMACDPLRSASEFWFVGGEHVARAAREHGASALIVSEMLDPGAPSRIRVTAASAQQAGVRDAVLNVPPGPAAVKLLRDPFDTHVAGRQATSHAIAPGSNILFSPDGRKLYVRGVAGEVMAVQIPNSPRAQVGPPWTFAAPAGHSILAIGQCWSKRRAVVLSQQENELTVHVLSRRGGLANEVRRYTAMDYRLPPPTDGMPLRPLGFFEPRLCFIDSRGNLIELNDGLFSLRDDAAGGASRAGRNGFEYVRTRPPAPQAMVARANRSGEIEISPLPVPLERRAAARYYFGAYGPAKLVACGDDGSPCLVFRGVEQMEIAVPRTHTVIGMIERWSDRLEPFVVAIDADRRRIDAFGRIGSVTLLTTAADITYAAVSDAEYVVAFITRSGDLGVYSCQAGALVVQVTGGRT